MPNDDLYSSSDNIMTHDWTPCYVHDGEMALSIRAVMSEDYRRSDVFRFFRCTKCGYTLETNYLDLKDIVGFVNCDLRIVSKVLDT